MGRRRKKSNSPEQIAETIKIENEKNFSDVFGELANFIHDKIYSKNVVAHKPVYISTGVKTLDTIMGGGFVTGLTSILTSPPETGKSTISLQAAARLLKEHPNSIIIYIDTENPGITDENHTFKVLSRLQQFGVDINDEKYSYRFFYLPGLRVFSNIYATIKQILDKKKELEEKYNLEPIPALIIWDSIAESIPDELLEHVINTGELLKQKGIKARTVQDYLSVITYLCERSNTGLIILDQVRSNIQINPRGVGIKQTSQHKDIKSATSSKALEHKSRQWLFLEKGEEIIHKYPGVTGWILKITMDKSKLVASTGMTIEVVFDKMRGLDSFWSHYHFLSNRMPYEQKFLSRQDVPSQLRRYYEENAPLAIERNKISYPGVGGEYSFRSKTDIIKEYKNNPEFKEFFDKVLEKSIQDRILSWIDPNSKFQQFLNNNFENQ
jgi:RecA/RadA recombinase